jgi:LytS/YehU family sensor histidine kinase
MFKEKYEAEKKDKEIIAKNLEISNKNILIFKISAGALSVILIFLALFFSQRNKKNKLQKEKVEKEAEINRVSAESATLKNELSKANQRMLIRLMDPHSSSNNLSTIQRYILENDKQKANQMLTDFASLHRKIYEACQEDFIELEQELEIIETYLNIEKEHYAGRLETKLDIDKEIETDSLKILPMLIYPIVENAIIHGLRHKEGNEGLLQIKIGKKDDKNYTFVIEDNGIGRKQSAEINKHRKPTGLDNVKKRIEQTNKMSAYNYLFEIEDLYDKNNKPNGTRVKFHILLS